MTTTATSASTAYNELIEIVRDADLLGGTAAILGWDQEVLMPPGGLAYRSRQLAQIARLRHERLTAPRVGELIAACEENADLIADPTSPAAVNVRELRRDHDRMTKLPPELVAEEAELASLGQHTWAEARRNDAYDEFKPTLARIIDLLRRKAARYGWPDDGEPWDALAEDYEPGATAREIQRVFDPLRDRLQTLLREILDRGRAPAAAFNERPLPIDRQRPFAREVAEAIGFDFHRGRLDTSVHPFCSGSHCNDVRLTTRYKEHPANDGLSSVMHEAGHGMYEQGLLTEHVGTPMGTYVSLGIHESQSRLWENQVGRSRAFWTWCHPRLRSSFGDGVEGLSVDDVYGAVNLVQPSPIRVEADEATYNMHIFVRFEIERAILSGDLDVDDLPETWNARYRDYLGIEIESDATGCLQDIHWSMASMGYFPTYTLGNLYGAQFFDKALEDMPDLHEQFARGEFGSLLDWLRRNIHVHGRRYRPHELCEVVTGRPLSADPLIHYLEGKLRPLYGL